MRDDRADASTVSVHCHNDLGLAVANSLAGDRDGARQVEVAVNGIGERAGNCSLEEIVMALHTRPGRYRGATTGIATEQIIAAQPMVSYLTGLRGPAEQERGGSQRVRARERGSTSTAS